MKDDLLFYNAYEDFYSMVEKSDAFKAYCIDAFGADFSQDGFSDLSQIKRLLSYIPKKQDVHILDIGCGNGKMLKFLQKETNAYIHGFDYSENAIGQAASDCSDKADFRVGVMGEIEYQPEMFDVIISMDSIYFAPDMSEFVGQIRNWLKPNGVFLVGYQEGDVMPKTQNQETTVLAKALSKNSMNYNVIDITSEVYSMLQTKRISIEKHKSDFLSEGLTDWYDMVLHQTDCATVPFDEYKANNARYFFVATK